MSEEWRSIPGYDTYEASNLGRVRRITILKPRLNADGYECITPCAGGAKKMCRVHRLVALAFLPNPEDKLEVNHLDKNRANNRLENLEWATRKENMEHMRRKLSPTE